MDALCCQAVCEAVYIHFREPELSVIVNLQRRISVLQNSRGGQECFQCNFTNVVVAENQIEGSGNRVIGFICIEAQILIFVVQAVAYAQNLGEICVRIFDNIPYADITVFLILIEKETDSVCFYYTEPRKRFDSKNYSILCSAAAKAEIESGQGVNFAYRLHPIPQKTPKKQRKTSHF